MINFNYWKILFTDRVSVNKKYLTDSVSVNKKFLTDSGVPIEKKTRGSLLVVIGGKNLLELF